jgi:hypothetical protein
MQNEDFVEQSSAESFLQDLFCYGEVPITQSLDSNSSSATISVPHFLAGQRPKQMIIA